MKKKETTIITEKMIEIKGVLARHDIVRKVVNIFIDAESQQRGHNVLLQILTAIYDCSENDVDRLLENYPNLQTSFQMGAKVDVLLKVVKWMFIMEDIVYWNYKGRAKLYDAIKEG